ncbi:UDP-N-acetylmuramoyl-tripeptide--D-alanyl-D-alanine ligase [Pseudorhodoferax sp. Leaf267]|uniref:UDP-N-acetylmuramoyl-tripeptide--D-alanyl-D- alanine ligase n=1 Tax=Pseudorhodoferax sp. Leaf267 TaxID=1736316 RepID=UPI0006F840DA|nr:UDP-N-acetylmuramoyl-tripeptide--D-alanyl-D-alanine ligase [Pseudorhodoferax sp. Leaf267]KQP14133.1 UDP-N-acetylmuramoylalanyl-D-glutamyl-2, 6-diaminopimelate--D-alanyl-D-alanine ligase [Pseudorhodoferax sp. Leaf267]
MMMTLQQALAWLPGASLFGDGNTAIARVHSDTRTLADGDLFVAIRGERFDANTMLAQAKASGAVAALCLPGASGGFANHGLPCIEVADTIAALGALARGWRAQFSLPFIAVTGSNGKTTVTQMTASILRAHAGDAAFATQGNLNNDIGLPLTLLRLRETHRIGVVELGMNHPGEIALLAAIAQPTVALVNNAQREHMEFMATVEAVARENGTVIDALPPTGRVVIPATDDFAPLWRQLAGQREVLRFAIGTGAEITAEEPRWGEGAWQVQVRTPQGGFECRLHIAGRHNVQNALAATAAALAAGVPLAAIAAGLSAFEPVKGRSRALSIAGGITLVDDSYNANPDSVQAAIAVLAALPGPRLLVLGDMGEVGDAGPRFHAEVGEQARAAGIEQLFALGAQAAHTVTAFGPGARHFADVGSLIAAARAQLASAASVLVKGSRFMKMERVVDALREEGPHAA